MTQHFYTALGQRAESWSDARFTAHLVGGLRWALDPASPRPEPSASAGLPGVPELVRVNPQLRRRAPPARKPTSRSKHRPLNAFPNPRRLPLRLRQLPLNPCQSPPKPSRRAGKSGARVGSDLSEPNRRRAPRSPRASRT